MSEPLLIAEEILAKFKENHNHEDAVRYGEKRIRGYKDACLENEQNSITGDCCGVPYRTSGSVGSYKELIKELRETHERIAEIHYNQIKKLSALIKLEG